MTRLGEGLVHLGARVAPEALLALVAPERARVEDASHPRHRVGPQARLLVGRFVEGHGHGLDERPTLPPRGPGTRLAHHLEDRHDVGAVHLNAMQAVRLGLDREPRARGLTRRRGAHGPAVVPADGDERRPRDAGEVQPRVEVAAARRAVAEEHQDGLVRPPRARGPRQARRVRDLRAHERARRDDAPGLPERHSRGASSLARIARSAEGPVGAGSEWHAAPERRGHLALAPEDPVVVLHRRGSSDDRALLARGARVRADGTLALKRDEPLIESARKGDLLVERHRELIGAGVGGLGHGGAVEGGALG